MLTDHIGAVLFPSALWLRFIGRIAFPIFCFLLVEGFYHTRDVKKYALRLLAFCFISEIPFDLAFNGAVLETGSQNVFFTLFLGLVMMWLMKKCEDSYKYKAFIVLVFIVCAGAAAFLSTDYSAGGILIIFIFYYFREKTLLKFILFGIVSYVFFGWIEMFCLIAIIPILLYNGERGPSMKYVFYAFYPVHLLILSAIALVV